MDFILILFILSVLSFIGFIYFSFSNYKKRFNNTYDVRNMFPYELNFEGKFQDNLLGNLFLTIYSVSSLVLAILLPVYHKGSGGIVFLMVASILTYFFAAFICFAPLKYLRLHILTCVIFVSFTFAGFGAIAFTSLEFYNIFLEPVFIVISVFGFIFLFFLFLLLMNPKLNTWAKVETKQNPDGTVTAIRPKYFVLAFTEWLTLFSSIILLILTFILHVLIGY